MPRRAWLLFTPEMREELEGYVRRREEWVVVANELPTDWKAVDRKPARGGAEYWLIESRDFDDVRPNDYPELKRPVLMPLVDYLRVMKVAGSC